MKNAAVLSLTALLLVSALQCGAQSDAGSAAFEEVIGDSGTVDSAEETAQEDLILPGDMAEEDGAGPVPCEVGEPCDDGDPCTTNDMCKGGFCSGQSYDCDDGLQCTRDVCLGDGQCKNELRNGFCLIEDACFEEGELNPELPCLECITSIATDEWTPDNDNSCEDGDPCTSPDYCLGGLCMGRPMACAEDQNPCTRAVCSDGACSQEPASGPCDDGDPCTLEDQCSEGACVPAQTMECDDSNPCTDDICLPGLGCRNIPNVLPCDDGNQCTLDDTCSQGMCRPGTALKACDDGNPCTNDTCHPELGCIAFPNNAPCDDGDPCLEGDFCAAGVCQPGFVQITCADGEVCTDDYCEPFQGCVFVANQADCDDANPCTLNDFCQNSQCSPGPGSLVCDDLNECTADSCVDGTGCVFEPLSGIICSDQSVCTDFDQCVAGECQGLAISCDDGNPCTADSCDPVAGCFSQVLNIPECRPVITISWPPRGITLDGDPVVVVSGTVTSPAAPIATLTINGETVEVKPDSTFQHPMTSAQAMNLIMGEAWDLIGGYGKAVQSYYYSTKYYPVDSANPAQSMVNDGLMIFLGKDVWDDNDTSDIDDIATILTVYLGNMDLNGMIQNPVTTSSFGWCNYKISVKNIGFGTPQIDLVPTAGGLNLGIVLPNFKADVEADASEFACIDVSGTAKASSVSVTGKVLISVDGAGNVSVTLQTVTVKLNGFSLDLSGVTGALLNWLVDLFEDTIASELESALKDQLSAMIPSLLKDVLESLALNQEFEVPPFIGEGEPVTLGIRTGLSSAVFTDEGSVLGLKATVVAPKAIGHTPLGSIGRAACLGAPEQFQIPKAGQLEIALADDLLNQIPYGIYWGGLLDLALNEQDIGTDLSGYGITELVVNLDALLPPILTSCNEESALKVQIGDMRIDATMNLFEMPVTLTAYASLEVDASIVAVDGAAGKEMGIALGDVQIFEVQIVSITGALAGAEDALVTLIKENLVGGLLGGLAGGALGSFPIPAIDLSTIDPTLPAGSVIELDLVQIMRLFGYTALSGNVKE